LVEILIVIALIIIFTLMTLPVGIDFYREQIIEGQASRLADSLKIAQSRAVAAKQDSSWGIAFHEPEEGQYTLFRGGSYAQGDEYDVFLLENNITLEGGINEIVFQKNTGRPIINPVN